MKKNNLLLTCAALIGLCLAVAAILHIFKDTPAVKKLLKYLSGSKGEPTDVYDSFTVPEEEEEAAPEKHEKTHRGYISLSLK
ncbi:MAG: hypothetical protein U0K57_10335 [Lachnospiraceae bacterium]|nr:hypothetical protein [Lachnospiraceae bacterium]